MHLNSLPAEARRETVVEPTGGQNPGDRTTAPTADPMHLTQEPLFRHSPSREGVERLREAAPGAFAICRRGVGSAQ